MNEAKIAMVPQPERLIEGSFEHCTRSLWVLFDVEIQDDCRSLSPVGLVPVRIQKSKVGLNSFAVRRTGDCWIGNDFAVGRQSEVLQENHSAVLE